jgi:hypothetical protein
VSPNRGIGPGPTRIASAICVGVARSSDGAIWFPPIESPLPNVAGRDVDEGDRRPARAERPDERDDRTDLLGREGRRLTLRLDARLGEGHPAGREHEVDGGRSRVQQRGAVRGPLAHRTMAGRAALLEQLPALEHLRLRGLDGRARRRREQGLREAGADDRGEQPRPERPRSASSHRMRNSVENNPSHTTSTKCQ